MGTVVEPISIEIELPDGYRLEGVGHLEMEKGQLMGADDGEVTERGDVAFLALHAGWLEYVPTGARIEMDPGDYVLCRGGLYEKVLP